MIMFCIPYHCGVIDLQTVNSYWQVTSTLIQMPVMTDLLISSIILYNQSTFITVTIYFRTRKPRLTLIQH